MVCNKKLEIVQFHAACNSPENGMFVGRFDACQFAFWDGSELTMDCMPTRIRDKEGILTVGRVKVPHRGCSEWVGNWCWDLWLLLPQNASKVIEYLIEQRRASYDEVHDGEARKHWNAFCKSEDMVIL